MYKAFKFVAAAATALAMMVPETSQAFGPGSLGRELGRVNRAYIPTASRTAAPFAALCSAIRTAGMPCFAQPALLKTVLLTETRLKELKEVNASVNRRILPAKRCRRYLVPRTASAIVKTMPLQNGTNHRARLAFAGASARGRLYRLR